MREENRVSCRNPVFLFYTMTAFHFLNQMLHVEEVPVRDIVAQVGTPVYIYSARQILENFHQFDQAFHSIPHLTCYAVKANSNLSLLALLAQAGSGADIGSGGELYRALKAGIAPEKITYSGVGKTEQEFVEALQAGVQRINIESSQEFGLIYKIARELNTPVYLSPRINPDIDAQTHPYIATGLKENKFGMSVEQARTLCRHARECSGVHITGVSMHIGSQMTLLAPLIEATEVLASFVQELRQDGFQIETIDLGGGLGIRYHQETAPTPEEYGNALLPILRSLGCRVIVEPGRAIVGNAGILVMKVLYTKQNASKYFTIVDAAMTDCIRPALYDAYHEVLLVHQVHDTSVPIVTTDVVGQVCESADFFAKNRQLPQPQPGDLLALFTAGAYGFSMASHYNSRPNAAEVLAHKGDFHVVRQRETYADLIRGEDIHLL